MSNKVVDSLKKLDLNDLVSLGALAGNVVSGVQRLFGKSKSGKERADEALPLLLNIAAIINRVSPEDLINIPGLTALVQQLNDLAVRDMKLVNEQKAIAQEIAGLDDQIKALILTAKTSAAALPATPGV